MAETPEQPANPDSDQEGGAQSEVDQAVQDALAEAQAAVDSMQSDAEEAGSETATAASGAAAFDQADFSTSSAGAGSDDGMDLLGDVNLDVTIELGRTEMLVEDVLKLNDGSVVELDKLAGDPVDIYVNNRLIARGEVLVLNENFCIRISEIIDSLREQAAEAAEQEVQLEAG